MAESVAEEIGANFCLAWLRISLFIVPYSFHYSTSKMQTGAKKKLLMTFATKNSVELSDRVLGSDAKRVKLPCASHSNCENEIIMFHKIIHIRRKTLSVVPKGHNFDVSFP